MSHPSKIVHCTGPGDPHALDGISRRHRSGNLDLLCPTCGALTGGCCLIGMYAGGEGEGRDEHEKLQRMLEEYVDWFREESLRFGGSDCQQISGGNPMQRAERCPGLILESVRKAREILEANGFELDGQSGEEQLRSNR